MSDQVGAIGTPRIAATVAGVAGRSAALTQAAYAQNNAVANPLDYQGVGDGATDDTAAINAAAVGALGTTGVAGVLCIPARSWKISGAISIPAGVTIDARGAQISAAASWSLAKGVRVIGGVWSWSITTAIDLFTPTDDNCEWHECTFVGAGAIGTSGAALYQRAINGTKYNNGVVESCSFKSMTVGVWVGGASTDATPTGWRVCFNRFDNIVGYRGQSEGYGVLLTPGSSSVVQGNIFTNIARHAIYLAGGACRNVVADNVIDTVDNVGIQVNTFLSQPASDGNVIAHNRIRNVTKSIAYGYASSVGIGMYGNNTNTVVFGNHITNFLDRGIDWSSISSDHTTSVVGFGARILCNVVDNTGAADTCIRVDDADDVTVAGNALTADQNTYGIVTAGALAPAVGIGVFRDNTIRGVGAGTVGVRIASTGGAHQFKRNLLTANGTLYSTGGAGGGIIIEPYDGYLGIGDNDYTYNVGATGSTLNQTTAITANRIITLAHLGAGSGSRVRVARPSTGAFTVSVKDEGGTVLKALSTGQWLDAVFDGAVWQSVAFGSL